MLYTRGMIDRWNSPASGSPKSAASEPCTCWRWLAWLVALPLSIPAAYFLATKGLAFALNTELVYTFTPSGALLWLAILASALPARGAARISVRESLAYQ